jgi:hypothetical protein
VEKILKRPITEIQNILNNGDEAVREELTTQLSAVFADLLVTAVSEKNEIKKFANTVLVPNIVSRIINRMFL